ncbi:MAG TPA: HPr-rel-A system PqqD family peptide chaperone [Sphingomonas sp.]|nr:HPr-rel-A system PqqD family peptide chaperone [Sphingomonas sp.]
MPARYAADTPESRIAAPLDELTAIFHRPSGATHLLASPAPELLEALAEGPADAAELLARLSGRYEMPDATPEGLAARLDELVATGLAWRV